jgi:hypothetical protein
MKKAPDPKIDPSVTLSPAAMKYLHNRQDRMAAGAPVRPATQGPPIPRLDLAPEETGVPMSMAQHAAMQRQHLPQAQGGPVPQSIFGSPGAAPRTEAPGAGIEANDLLPPEAMRDPEYRDGINASLAINQPGLAHKYGVVRNGVHIPPKVVRGSRPGQLSDATLEGLNAIRELEQQQAQAAASAQAQDIDRRATAASQSQIGGGGAPPPPPAPPRDIMDAIEDQHAKRRIDSFDYERLVDLVTKDLLSNDDERMAVESRLEPLKLETLIRYGYIEQRVPIVPGSYEPTFISYDGQVDLNVKRLIFTERFKDGRVDLEAADRYYIDRFSMMAVACGLSAINEVKYPGVTDRDGNFDEKLFYAKLDKVLRLPFHMIISLSVHFQWFDIRVRKLFQGANLKNS